MLCFYYSNQAPQQNYAGRVESTIRLIHTSTKRGSWDWLCAQLAPETQAASLGLALSLSSLLWPSPFLPWLPLHSQVAQTAQAHVIPTAKDPGRERTCLQHFQLTFWNGAPFVWPIPEPVTVSRGLKDADWLDLDHKINPGRN